MPPGAGFVVICKDTGGDYYPNVLGRKEILRMPVLFAQLRKGGTQRSARNLN